MRSEILVALVFISFIPLKAQKPDGLLQELQAVHATWFKAFDAGDGATMDELETENLVLVMPDGTIFPKAKARAGTQPRHEMTEHSLSDAVVRRFNAPPSKCSAPPPASLPSRASTTQPSEPKGGKGNRTYVKGPKDGY